MFDNILDKISTDGWYAACRFRDAIKRFDQSNNKKKNQQQQQQLILFYLYLICWKLSSKHETHSPFSGDVHGPTFTWKLFPSDSNENSKIRRTKCENFMRLRWIVMWTIFTHSKFRTQWNEYNETQTNEYTEKNNKNLRTDKMAQDETGLVH